MGVAHDDKIRSRLELQGALGTILREFFPQHLSGHTQPVSSPIYRIGNIAESIGAAASWGWHQ